MDYSKVLQFQDDMVARYRYKPIPPLYRDETLSFYRDNLPVGFSLDGGEVPLYSPEGLRLCNRYHRIVIGDYGAFVEIFPEDIVHENIKVKEGQEYRDTDERYAKHTKYSWLTSKDKSNVKIYFQKKVVDYADYIPGRYYISPYECFLPKGLNKESSSPISRDRIKGWLKEHGVYSVQLLDYYEKAAPAHCRAFEDAIRLNVFPGDFEYWMRLNEVCEVNGGLSYTQYETVRYNLDLIHCKGDELKGRLSALSEDVRTAIQLGLEEFPFPCEAEKLNPSELRVLLAMPADKLLEAAHLSKILAGCKCEPLISDVQCVIDAAEQRAKAAPAENKGKEMVLG